jgi:hypothetical protein
LVTNENSGISISYATLSSLQHPQHFFFAAAMPTSLFGRMNSTKPRSIRYAPLLPAVISSYWDEAESRNSDEDSDKDRVTTKGVLDFTPRRNKLHVVLFVLIGLTCGLVIGLGCASVFGNKRLMSPKSVREFAPESEFIAATLV